jgi:hypothetical protein
MIFMFRIKSAFRFVARRFIPAVHHRHAFSSSGAKALPDRWSVQMMFGERACVPRDRRAEAKEAPLTVCRCVTNLCGILHPRSRLVVQVCGAHVSLPHRCVHLVRRPRTRACDRWLVARVFAFERRRNC